MDKNVNPAQRINNKNEFHQPGDVETIYEKNENEEFKKRKRMILENSRKEVPSNQRNQTNMTSKKPIEKSIEPNIIELLSNLRRQTNQNKQNQPENGSNEKVKYSY